jgi:hypothetical protein
MVSGSGAMYGRPWKLRYRTLGSRLAGTDEQAYETESGFKLGLQHAYRTFASDLVGTFPDGRVIGEAALRDRYPPQ